MAVFEIISDVLVRVFVDVIFRGVILRILNLLNDGITFIWCKLTGQKFTKVQSTSKNKLERQYLYKHIELSTELNFSLRTGQPGVILQVISNEEIFAEFYGPEGKAIEVNNETVFKLNVKQFRLVEERTNH